MSSFASEPIPLDIDDVQHLRETAGEVRLRVSGRWRGESPPAGAESALLVIQIEGRRHRFAPVSDAEPAAPGHWTATFVVPGWAEPRRQGQAALWIGEAVVPIPPIGASRRWPGGRPPARGSAVPADPPEGSAVAPVAPVPAVAPVPPVASAAPASAPEFDPVEPAADAGRSGPLADVLLKETVAALHGELEARAAESTRLRTTLAGVQSELEARSDTQTELEGTLGELGAELRRLMAAVEEQRHELDRRETDGAREREEFERRLAELAVVRDDQAAELIAVREELASAREELASAREQLAAAQVAREAAHSEVAGLRAELERLGTDLAVTRERVQSESGDLGEANRLLADARALAEQVRARPAAG